VELDDAIFRRRMCRDFLDRPLAEGQLERILERALRAPSAGHTQGWSFLVLEGAEQTQRFWAHDADPGWLAEPDHPGLLRAPVIVIPLASSERYLRRYQERDKVRAGRPRREDWSVPYWLVDTSFATMLLLLAVVQEGLGALFFALHGPERPLLDAFGVPEGWSALGAVALGWPAPDARPGSSAARGRRPQSETVHRGHWASS
jgi:nitroreductase